MAAFAFILALVVLIPVLAIVIDSPVGQALARRISGGDEGPGAQARIEALENEVQYLTQEVASLRDESTFLRSLVEERPPGALSAGSPGSAGDVDPESAGA